MKLIRIKVCDSKKNFVALCWKDNGKGGTINYKQTIKAQTLKEANEIISKMVETENGFGMEIMGFIKWLVIPK